MATNDEPAASDPRPATLIAATGFSYFPIALVARLPFAMMVVGVLTLVVSARGSVSLGGLNSAVAGLGTAIFGPLIGAAADRWGQRPVLLAIGALNSIALVAMTLVVYGPVPDWAVLAIAFGIGATAPQVSPMSRSRLVGIITRRLPAERRTRTLNATMAYESAADEVVFVFGPFLVGVLATTMQPAAPVIGAAALTIVFVTAFALHRTGAAVPPPTTDTGSVVAQAPARELVSSRLFVVVAGVCGMGLFFGAMLTALTAFMAEHGHASEAGVLYGLLGVGSAVLALSVAAFPARFSLRARWLVFAAILLAGTLSFAFVRDVGTMALVLFVTGVGVGPTLVTQYSLGAARSPLGRSATVMTILGSGIIVGQAASSAVTGALADSTGASTAQFAPVVAATVVAVSGVANWALDRRNRLRAEHTPSNM